MFRLKLLSFFCLLIIPEIFAQNKTPIIVNNNIQQSNYRQSNPILFTDSSKGFLIKWEDYRYGTPTYFVQKFDENSVKVGDKYSTKNYYLISYSTNNNLFGMYRTIYSFSWPGWDGSGVQFWGEYFNKDQVLSEGTYIGGGDYPWCGTGWPGEGTSISRFNDELLVATDFGGTISLLKVYPDSIDTLFFPINPYEYVYGYSVATAYNSKGESLLAYFYRENYDSAAGIWIRSFSHNNDTINKCMVKEVNSELFDMGMRLNLIATSVSDSLFHLLYIDSLKLKSLIIDVQGNIVRENEYQILYKNDYPDGILYEDNLLSSSNYSNGNQAVFVQLHEYPNIFSNSLYTFNQDGDLIDTPLFDTTFTYKLNGQVFKDNNNDFLSTATINNKVYLLKFNNFNIIDTTIIDYEPANSNELRTRITKYKEEQFFVSYRNEVKTAGRFLSKNGNPISDEKEINSQSLKFFSDGTALQVWGKKDDNYKATKGFSILDNELNTVKTDTLVLNYDKYYGFCSATISPDDFFILIYQNSDGVFTTKYDKYGSAIKTVKISEDNNSSVGARVFFDEQKTFVYWNSYIYLFNEEFELEKVSKKYIYGIFAYLGNDEFAATLYDPQKKYSYYSILSSNGDTLLTDVTMLHREYSDPMLMMHVKNNEFLVFYLENNNLLANTYNSNGETIVDKFVVHDSEGEEIRDLTFSVNGNKVIFGWSGKQKGENDFDVYCVSYNIDLLTDVQKPKLTEVVNKFSLSQNYPNPFNPSTTIKYSIPSIETRHHANAGQVTPSVRLVIYDILGREVTTLVNKVQQPGSYEVIWDASNESSGVYYYQLKAGSFVKTKKMILLK